MWSDHLDSCSDVISSPKSMAWDHQSHCMSVIKSSRSSYRHHYIIKIFIWFSSDQHDHHEIVIRSSWNCHQIIMGLSDMAECQVLQGCQTCPASDQIPHIWFTMWASAMCHSKMWACAYFYVTHNVCILSIRSLTSDLQSEQVLCELVKCEQVLCVLVKCEQVLCVLVKCEHMLWDMCMQSIRSLTSDLQCEQAQCVHAFAMCACAMFSCTGWRFTKHQTPQDSTKYRKEITKQNTK